LVNFTEINKITINLYLKECEFNFNQKKRGGVYQILIKLFREELLKLS